MTMREDGLSDKVERHGKGMGPKLPPGYAWGDILDREMGKKVAILLLNGKPWSSAGTNHRCPDIRMAKIALAEHAREEWDRALVTLGLTSGLFERMQRCLKICDDKATLSILYSAETALASAEDVGHTAPDDPESFAADMYHERLRVRALQCEIESAIRRDDDEE